MGCAAINQACLRTAPPAGGGGPAGGAGLAAAHFAKASVTPVVAAAAPRPQAPRSLFASGQDSVTTRGQTRQSHFGSTTSDGHAIGRIAAAICRAVIFWKGSRAAHDIHYAIHSLLHAPSHGIHHPVSLSFYALRDSPNSLAAWYITACHATIISP